MHIGAAECDASEIWILGSQLGGNEPATDEDSDPTLDRSGLSWNQRRAIALERGEPEPTWDDVEPSPAEVAAQRRMMEQFAPMVPPSEDPPA